MRNARRCEREASDNETAAKLASGNAGSRSTGSRVGVETAHQNARMIALPLAPAAVTLAARAGADRAGWALTARPAAREAR